MSGLQLPDPKGGCACHYHGSDPLSGPPDVEYEPACPVHSEHVYDPRQGMWIFADPAKQAAWEADRAAVAKVDDWHDPILTGDQPEPEPDREPIDVGEVVWTDGWR